MTSSDVTSGTCGLKCSPYTIEELATTAINDFGYKKNHFIKNNSTCKLVTF